MKLEFRGRKINPTDDCQIRSLLNNLGDKWALLVIISLSCNGSLRFNDIQKLIGCVTDKMLTLTLRKLETGCVISRTVYSEMPPRTEYALTESGETLLQRIVNLVDWVNENLPGLREV